MIWPLRSADLLGFCPQCCSTSRVRQCHYETFCSRTLPIWTLIIIWSVTHYSVVSCCEFGCRSEYRRPAMFQWDSCVHLSSCGRVCWCMQQQFPHQMDYCRTALFADQSWTHTQHTVRCNWEVCVHSSSSSALCLMVAIRVGVREPHLWAAPPTPPRPRPRPAPP